jgi:cell division initiation protein
MVLSKLEELKSEESSIRSSLVKSQNIGEKIIRDAKERAEIILSSVEESSNEVIARFRNQLNAEKNELLRMRASILEFRREIFEMYKAHISELQNLPIGELEELVLPENSEMINSVYRDSAEKIMKYDESKKGDSPVSSAQNQIQDETDDTSTAE